MLVETCIAGTLAILIACVPGNRDSRDPRDVAVQLTDQLDQLEAIPARHAEIGDEQVRCRVRPVEQPRQRLIARRHHVNVGAAGGKRRRSQVARISVIVDNENPDADEIGQRRNIARIILDHRRQRNSGGKRNPEDGAQAEAGAAGAHLAALHLDQLPDQRQAEAQSALGPAHG